jgi:hypothetical protein
MVIFPARKGVPAGVPLPRWNIQAGEIRRVGGHPDCSRPGQPDLLPDPIAILTCAMTVGILPAFHYAVNASKAALYDRAFMRPFVDWVETACAASFCRLPPAFAQNMLIASLFGVLGLNLLAPASGAARFCLLGAFSAGCRRSPCSARW